MALFCNSFNSSHAIMVACCRDGTATYFDLASVCKHASFTSFSLQLSTTDTSSVLIVTSVSARGSSTGKVFAVQVDAKDKIVLFLLRQRRDIIMTRGVGYTHLHCVGILEYTLDCSREGRL